MAGVKRVDCVVEFGQENRQFSIEIFGIEGLEDDEPGLVERLPSEAILDILDQSFYLGDESSLASKVAL